jgi:hypothetical protein
MKPCTRCGAPSRHQWQSGAEWLPFCVRCDVELNAAALRLCRSSRIPEWRETVTSFIKDKPMPEPGSDEWRAILCNGPTEDIPDDDPGLALFSDGTLEDRKVALAIERVNSCD